MAKNSVQKRTRECPPYKAMFEQSEVVCDCLKAEVSYLAGKLDVEVIYNEQLIALLRKKGGGS